MSDCKEVAERIKSLAQRISLLYSLMFRGGFLEHYYWGNSPAFDCLNLEENEGYDHNTRINILFLGVGDLRNVTLACSSLPQSYERDIKFTLNDVDKCTLARLVLLLYMLIKGESGVEKTVTEIWYSVLLNEQAYTCLCTSLCELKDVPSAEALKLNTNGLVAIDDNHLKELQIVWKTWLDLRVSKTTWMQEQRQQEFDNDPGSSTGRMCYFNSIPPEHCKSARKWMKDGVFCSTKQLPLIAENPTLTGSDPTALRDCPFPYSCPSDTFPFVGWDYLEVKKFKHCNSVVTMYVAYIENVLQRFKQRLSTKRVSFHVILGNCMEIDGFLEPGVKYDRILTSNLIDYIPIFRLLKFCSKKLDHSNPYATIVTETQNWVRDYCPTADAAHPTNLFHQVQLVSTAVKDTNNYPLAVRGSGTSIREYFNSTAEFSEYLRASFYARFLTQEESGKPRKRRKLPSPKELGNELQLHLRDYTRNENRLVFFKLAVNCRRVSMVSGLERSLEWVPLQQECGL